MGMGEAASLQRTEKKPHRKAIIILSVLLLLTVGTSALLFVQYRREVSKNPLSQQQLLIKQLSQLVELPHEQPIISTVLDRNKLGNRVLASQAHNGDNLFIFSKSKRLILYRPADKKIVDMLNIQP